MFKFFHIPSHYVFNYQPRYYDPKKEKFKEKNNIENQENSNKEAIRRRISFREHRISRLDKEKQASLRRIIILFVLITLFYLLFFTNFIDVLLKIAK